MQQTIPSFGIFPVELIVIPLLLFLPMAGFGFLVVPFLVFSLVIYNGSKYIREIYQFKSNRDGMLFILAVLYGFRYPTRIIGRPTSDKEENETNWLDKGFGPGFLDVQQGYGVLLERLEMPSRILLRGKHYIKRYEKVRAVFDLKDIVVSVPELCLITKDRVIVRVNQFAAWFRILVVPDEENEFSKSTPKTSSINSAAITALNYNQLISADGKVSWDRMVVGIITKVLTDFVNDQTYSDLMGINREKSTRSIQNILDSPQTRELFHSIGTKMIRHEYIEVQISEEFEEDPRLKKWEETWREIAEKTRVEGESQKLAFQEFALPEVHAEVLSEIVEIMSDMDLSDDSEDNFYFIVTKISDSIYPNWLTM